MQLAPATFETHPKQKKKEFSWRVQMSVSPAADAMAALRLQTLLRQSTKRNQFHWEIHEVHEEICYSFQGGTRLHCVCKGRPVVFAVAAWRKKSLTDNYFTEKPATEQGDSDAARDEVVRRWLLVRSPFLSTVPHWLKGQSLPPHHLILSLAPASINVCASVESLKWILHSDRQVAFVGVKKIPLLLYSRSPT